MYDLSGKVAIVTGAGGRRGIGRAIATRLAKEGADVVVTDVPRDPIPEDESFGFKHLDSVVSEIEAMGRRSLGLFSDVSDASQVEEMVQRTLHSFGKIDILVCNAGSQPGGDRRLLVDLQEDAFDLVQRVNVKGTFLCCREVCRHMIERGGPGKIVIMSSRAGKQGNARYCRLLRLEVRRDRHHGVAGAGDGALQSQRQRDLPRPGRHRARLLHGRRPAPRRHERRGLPAHHARRPSTRSYRWAARPSRRTSPTRPRSWPRTSRTT